MRPVLVTRKEVLLETEWEGMVFLHTLGLRKNRNRFQDQELGKVSEEVNLN